MINIKVNTITTDEFLKLYTSVGWDPPPYEMAELAIKNSMATFTAYDNEKPAAVARLLGDGAMSHYIKDLAVLPEYQGRGIGRMLIESIEDYILKNLQPGWATSLELISSLNKEVFYEKLGFERRPSKDDGAGMFKMVFRKYE